MLWRFPLVLLILFITGCGISEKIGGLISSKEVVDPPAELTEFQPSVELIRHWDRNIGKGTDEQYLMLSPVIGGDVLYISDINGKLTALNTSNGKTVWSRNLDFSKGGFWSRGDKVQITGGPGYGENSVIVGSNKGDVAAYDPLTGEEFWKTKVTSEVLSSPRKTDNIVIVRTLDGKIFGLSGDAGRRLWTYDRSVPALTLRGTGTPAVGDGLVVCGFDGGRLAALEASTGRVIWETSIAIPRGRSELERMVDIDTTPVIVEGVIYIVAFQGQLAALTLDSGRMLWNREISSHQEISVDADNVYVTDDKSTVWAFDRFSGSPVWKQEGLYNRMVSGPGSLGNYVIVGDFEGYLHWLDKTTGAFSARYRLSRNPVITTPVTSGDSVYAYSVDGKLAAIGYR